MTDRDLDVSVFAEEALHNLEVSQASMLNESQYEPVIVEGEEDVQNAAYPTDDDTSPIPSDVEMFDDGELDDLPDDNDDDFDADGASEGNQGSQYTSSGTLKRHRKKTRNP